MEFELLNTTNINLVRDCFNRCRKRNLSLNFFKKKYSTKWSGMPLLGIIAMDGDIPIALRCTTIYKFNSAYCNYKVAQCGDLVVDENYRNKGLATEMIMEIEKQAIRNNIDAIVVFPNKKANKIYEKLDDWRPIGNFYSFSFKVNTIPLLKLLNKLHLNDLYFNILRRVSSNAFISKIKNKEITENDKIGVYVDSDYLDYKTYGKYSCHLYNDKAIIWTFSDGLVVLFSEVTTKKELEQEIQHLKSFCQKRGIHRFSYYCYSGSMLYSLLSSDYEAKPTLPVYAYQINSNLDCSKMVFNGIDRNAFDL